MSLFVQSFPGSLGFWHCRESLKFLSNKANIFCPKTELFWYVRVIESRKTLSSFLSVFFLVEFGSLLDNDVFWQWIQPGPIPTLHYTNRLCPFPPKGSSFLLLNIFLNLGSEIVCLADTDQEPESFMVPVGERERRVLQVERLLGLFRRMERLRCRCPHCLGNRRNIGPVLRSLPLCNPDFYLSFCSQCSKVMIIMPFAET